jgi:Ser/Thr protein kinase RdoA (MazF antagonist)
VTDPAAVPTVTSEPVETPGGLDVAWRAISNWDLEPASIELLLVSENQTYAMVTKTGERFVIRIHRHGYSSLAEMESEHHWVAALAEVGFGIAEPVLTSRGSAYVATDFGDGTTRQVGVMRWVDGASMGDTLDNDPDLSETLFAELGHTIGELHNHTNVWTPPPEFTRRRWDVEGLLGDNAHWGRFWDMDVLSAAARSTFQASRTEIRKALREFGDSPDRFGLIHADLHIENVLQSSRGQVVIDFDDSGYGWHMYDVAVALVHHESPVGHTAVRDALIGGYRTARHLDEDQISMISMFMLMRSLVLTSWVEARPELGRESTLRASTDKVSGQCERFLAGVDPYA